MSTDILRNRRKGKMADQNKGFTFVTPEKTEDSNVGAIRSGRKRTPMQLAPYSLEASRRRKQNSPNRPKKNSETRAPIKLKLRTSKSRLGAENKSARPGVKEGQEIKEREAVTPKKSTLTTLRMTPDGPKKSLIVKLPIAPEKLRALVEERDESVVSPGTSAYSPITTHTGPPLTGTTEGQPHDNGQAPQRLYTLQEVEAVFGLMGFVRWPPAPAAADDAMDLDG